MNTNGTGDATTIQHLGTTAAWARPGLPLLLGSAAVVGAAGVLGFEPVTRPFAGIPVGLWLIGAVQAGAYVVQRSIAAGSAHATDWSLWARSSALPTAGQLAATGLSSLRPLADLAGIDADDLASRGCSRLEEWAWPSSPVRVATTLGPDAIERIRAATDGHAVEFIAIESFGVDPAVLLSGRYDALLALSPSGEIELRVAESELESAWFDWSASRPLTYANVFPVRLDTQRAALGRVNDPSTDFELVGLIAACAATLARVPARLSFTNRLAGRMPISTPPSALLAATARRLGESAAGPSAATRAAARLLSAWAATADADLVVDARRATIDACVRAAGAEAEVLLRALAVRLSLGDEEAAFPLVTQIRDAIRARDDADTHNDLAFLNAELELGGTSPLAIGRIAAGVCLASARSSREEIGFFRGDFLDDAGHADWLVGRDQDRALIIEVFRRLEHAAEPAAPTSPASERGGAPTQPASASPDIAGTIPRTKKQPRKRVGKNTDRKPAGNADHAKDADERSSEKKSTRRKAA